MVVRQKRRLKTAPAVAAAVLQWQEELQQQLLLPLLLL